MAALPLPPPARADWAYFLDVDGTLVDLADAPGAVRVAATVLDLVAAVRQASGGALALVSGRSLADLDRLFQPLRLPVAGQHGLERRDTLGRIRRPALSPAHGLAIRTALQPVLARHPGLLLEDKGLALALHYRRAPRLAAYVHRLLRGLPAAAGWQLQPGKCVAELRPHGADKGSAIADYLAEPPFHGRLPVFVGDDRSDEHAFAAVNRVGGLAIKVGLGRTQARYRLADVAAVRRWLAGTVAGSARI